MEEGPLSGFSAFILAIPLAGVAGLGIGYLIGEGMSLSVNRKRGRALPFIAAGSMVASFLASSMVFSYILVGNPLRISPVVDLWGWLLLALAVFIAIARVR